MESQKELLWKRWDEYGYRNAYSKDDFEDVKSVLDFLQNKIGEDIDYDKIQFGYVPQKIVVVIADNIPKDLYYYSSKDKPTDKKHINLRNILLEK